MKEVPSARRLERLLYVLLIWACLIVGRLVSLQVLQHDELQRQADTQHYKTIPIPSLRGAILDRNGQALAKTLPADSVSINPRKIKDAVVAANILAPLLGLDRDRFVDRLLAAKANNAGFLWVKKKVPAEQVAQLRQLNLDWVEFQPTMLRYYPQSTLASHVVGSLGVVEGSLDDSERGNAGLEMAFDEELAGRPGIARNLTDVHQNSYDSEVLQKPEAGVDLTLTLDAKLQYVAERELDKAVESSHASTGSIVALNPYTGDILAMANYPRFDPNLPPSPDDPPMARSNLAITTPFEPGSVFKVITLAAALETTSLTPDSVVPCGNGTLNLFGRIIHDHDRYAALSMADVLAHSSNIGAIQIGLKVGEKRLYDYVSKFGFGQKTDIEMPGESGGLLRQVKQWTPSSIGSVAMGHEVSATSIQLALAGAAVANGGLMVKPRIVASRRKADGVAVETAIEKPTRILKPETTIQLRQMMEGVVLRGTGKKAAVRGYTIGGKTGSAQIYDLKNHVYTHNYNSSFLGLAPLTNPQVVIVVTLNGTTGGAAGYGGAVAAPVFREVATAAMRMLDVPKDVPEAPAKMLTKAHPLERENFNDLPIAGLGGEPPTLLASAQGPGVRMFGGTKAPDFRGHSVRDVLEQAGAVGVRVEVLGSGMAKGQVPPPGAVLAPGEAVRVQFGR